jgi:demethylmenaquinone methyltransferase/2-methoxy-6-polyprenyl-1,4-benzoquinol methylase
MYTAQKPDQIRSMFASIAHRYDLLNHLLSLGTDIYWRKLTVKSVAKLVGQDPILALDVCCGTADLALALSQLGRVIGCDFCHPMLILGNQKIRHKGRREKILLTEGDALKLPFPDGTFDAVTIAFGLRNLASPRHGLAEMQRVLKPGGVLAVLEFSKPVLPVFSQIFAFYFTKVLPRIGRLISGQGTPYTYLPASVALFPDQARLKEMMEMVGFTRVSYRNLSGGVAALHTGTKG